MVDTLEESWDLGDTGKEPFFSSVGMVYGK